MSTDTTAPARALPVGTPVLTPIIGRAPLRLQLVCLLLVVASVSWRRDTYYDGGVDPVVLAKAALTLLALALALTGRLPARAWSRFRASPVLWLGSYLVVTSVGAVLADTAVASVVLVVRLALVAAIVLVIVLTHPWHQVINAVAAAMLLVGMVAGITGIPHLLTEGRLHGGIPAISANEVCFLVAVPLVLLVWAAVNRHGPPADRWAILPLLAVVAATGSRTGAAALVVVLLVVVVTAPRIPAPAVVATMMTAPVALYLTAYTDLVAQFASRGGSTDVSTLSSRTVAWEAALDRAGSLGSLWFGEGIAVRKIPVSAMYRSEQILDSTWVSAYVQAGIAGTALLLLLVLVTWWRAIRLPAPYRSLAVGVLGLVTIASLLESGMFDTKPAFIVFFCTTLLVHRTEEFQ